MRLALAFLAIATLQAQTPSFRPLHVSPVGIIVDDSGKPVLLRGINRSATGSGNADATATDQDYAAQNQLLPINLVRIFVNAAWWNSNVQVPIANTTYQTYIDGLIQRAKKYGNYVLMVAQDPAGYTDSAFTFWASFAKKYAADPAVLYDTWEDMNGIDIGTWSDDQNQLIVTIRLYNPLALIFVEDIPTAFESIVAGKLADFTWSNIVWNFHLYAGPAGTCTEPSSPRYANWPKNLDPLVSYAQQYGHAAAIVEWGGCNDSEPYHTNITSYAQAHDLALAYFDNTNLLAQSGGAWQLTATGTKVAQAYSAIVTSGPPANNGGPALRTSQPPVQDAENNRAAIVPGAWVSVYGTNFSDIIKNWDDQDFSNGLPTSVAGVQVLVNGSPAPVLYVSPGQVNFQALGYITGTATVTVVRNGIASSTASVSVVSISPGLNSYSADYKTFYAAALFANTATVVGDPSIFGGTVRKARPGDTLQLYASGLTATQSGLVLNSAIPFSSPLTVNIGSTSVTALNAAQVGPGQFQINFTVPAGLAAGNYPITITVNGAPSQDGVVLVVGP